MRGKVRAKERGVWGRLTNQLYDGNATNHGYCSGSVAPSFSVIFSYILFTALFIIALSPTLSLLLDCRLPRESCDKASHSSLTLAITFILPSTPLQFPLQTHLKFPPPPPKPFPPPGFLFHLPPCSTHSTPLCQSIILSAVTKEIHTPSITMYKFSVRGFGRVLIKKPFHSFP